MSKKIKFIDTEEEHNKVLFELGILDDLEDWELFQIQEEFKRDEAIDDEAYEKYKAKTPSIYSEDLPEAITALLDEHFSKTYKSANLKQVSIQEHLSYFKRELKAFDIHIANDRPFLYEDTYADLDAYKCLVKIIFQLENYLRLINQDELTFKPRISPQALENLFGKNKD